MSQFSGNDSISAAKLNQKSVFVGTGAQINSLSTTYAGQMAYCTSTGSSFTIDHLYIRNATNSAWVDYQTVNTSPVESSEQNSTPVTDDSDLTPVAGTRYYAFVTLPSNAALWIITAIEASNGAAVAGNIVMGADVIDANPPVIASTPLVAISQEVAQAGTNTIQKVSVASSCPLRAGTLVGIWIEFSSASARGRVQTGAGSQNQSKATSYNANPNSSDNTVWSTSTSRIKLKLYFRSYS